MAQAPVVVVYFKFPLHALLYILLFALVPTSVLRVSKSRIVFFEAAMSALYLALLAGAALPCLAQSTQDSIDTSQCKCFLSNGTNPGFYSKHAFFDFRSLGAYAGVPALVNVSGDAASVPVTSDYFKSDEWTSFWEIENWDNSKGDNGGFSNDASIYMVNSPSNIYIESRADGDDSNSTQLTMRTRRFADFQTASEFQTTASDYQFLSLRMLARTVGDPGAVTAMFTYCDSSDAAKVQEADIEILTRDPHNKIQYTNQPSDLPDVGEILEATRNATVPGGREWSDWAVHRLDWTPERSTWYVDGEEAASIEFQVPRDAASINFNSWGDGGSWSGNMSTGGEASLQIQWIEVLYNTTKSDKRGLGRFSSRSSSESASCNVICGVDGLDDIGHAVLLSNSTGAASQMAALTRQGGQNALLVSLLALLSSILFRL